MQSWTSWLWVTSAPGENKLKKPPHVLGLCVLNRDKLGRCIRKTSLKLSLVPTKISFSILLKRNCKHLKHRAVCYQSILLSFDNLTLACCRVWEGEGHITKPLLLDLSFFCYDVLTVDTLHFYLFPQFLTEGVLKKMILSSPPIISVPQLDRLSREVANVGALLDHREVEDHAGNPWQLPSPLVLVVKVNVLNLCNTGSISILCKK